MWILIKISRKPVPRGPFNSIPALVQIMAWHRPGDKPLSEPMMVSLLTHICVTCCSEIWIKIQTCSWKKTHLKMLSAEWQPFCSDLTHWGQDKVACSTPSHYLNQCCRTNNWIFRNDLQWNLNQNAMIFTQENAFGNVVYKNISHFRQLPMC